MRIERLTECTDVSKVTEAIREIFFLSADPNNISSDPVTNDAFYQRWTQVYFEHFRHLIYVARKPEGTCLGYLMGCGDSEKAVPYFNVRLGSYTVFRDLFTDYPAHLHINCHPEARGQGIGSALIERFVADLKARQVKGVHLVTSPNQRNVGFYRRNGFTFEVEREYRAHPLLFMGRELFLA